MNILKKFFAKKPEDLLERGDRLFSDHHFYEARCMFEDARLLLQGRGGSPDAEALLGECEKRIAGANHALAELNVGEAESAHDRGLHDKAAEHLELAKSLTKDPALREKADGLLTVIKKNLNNTEVLADKSPCSTCKTAEPVEDATHDSTDIDMPLLEYFDLLVQQLPPEVSPRYKGLGEDFAYFYVASCGGRHEEALELLEKWHDGSHNDIYLYEKGMLLYHLGKTGEALSLLRDSVAANAANVLAHLGLATMLIECSRFDEAAGQLDAMISAGILVEQSHLMRTDVYLLAGDVERAIDGYSRLLNTPLKTTAATRLHDALRQCGRTQDAEHVYKRYLSGCCH